MKRIIFSHNIKDSQKIMLLHTPPTFLSQLSNIEALYSQSLNIKKTERNALCALVYFRSHMHELSGFKPFI